MACYGFPDVEAGLCEVLEAAGFFAVLMLPPDFHDAVPIVQVTALTPAAAAEEFLQSTPVQVDIYAVGRSATRSLALAVRAALLGCHDTSAGLIDDVWVETEPHDAFYSHDSISLFSAVFRVDTRAV